MGMLNRDGDQEHVSCKKKNITKKKGGLESIPSSTATKKKFTVKMKNMILTQVVY